MTWQVKEQLDRTVELGQQFFSNLELLNEMQELKLNGMVKEMRYIFNTEMKLLMRALENTEAMALEFPDGWSVKAKVRKQGGLTPKQVKLLVDLGKKEERRREGLQKMHEQEMVDLMGYPPRTCGEKKHNGQQCMANALKYINPPVCNNHATDQQLAYNNQQKARARSLARKVV